MPFVVEVCTKFVEAHGLENQGIYRVPGNTAAVNMLQNELDKVGLMIMCGEGCVVGAGSAGVRYQGIYRVPGNTAAVNMLQNELDKVGLM